VGRYDRDTFDNEGVPVARRHRPRVELTAVDRKPLSAISANLPLTRRWANSRSEASLLGRGPGCEGRGAWQFLGVLTARGPLEAKSGSPADANGSSLSTADLPFWTRTAAGAGRANRPATSAHVAINTALELKGETP